MSISKEEQNQLSKKINEHKNKINELLIKIKNTKFDYDKIDLYREILKLDNTKEVYVLDYLLLLQKYDQKTFETVLEKFQVCLSDKIYNTYFSQYKRTNARQKILNFINLIKDSPVETDEEKSIAINRINTLLSQIDNIGFKNKKNITWENEELYLYSLYILLVGSISNLIIFYNKVNLDSKIINEPIYIQKRENSEMARNDNDINSEIRIRYFTYELINYLLFHSNFFNYIEEIKIFLGSVDENFHERFGSLVLCNNEDKSLFEDYINFLATYKFDKYTYISFWNETFIPLKLENKNKLIKELGFKIKFEYYENGKKLKISDHKDESLIIDADKYNLENLIYDSKYEIYVRTIKRKLNKYLKPTFYKSDLFVCNTKTHWKNLLIDIFRSKAYKQVRDSLFIKSQVDFFFVDEIIANIIDNIKFFIYNTSFLGDTNDYNNKIYEYGNFNIDIENESVSLLIFYGFHIIINIHEIGGHLNVKYQYYISLDETFHSPDIKEDLKRLYSNHRKERNKESGEAIELGLFGQVKDTLTIKEALFVLNKNNYVLTSEQFKANFGECNTKKLSELLDENMKVFLKKLEINPSNLDENDNNNYKYPIKRKFDSNEAYSGQKLRHPLKFYYNEPNAIHKFFQNPINKEYLDTLEKKIFNKK